MNLQGPMYLYCLGLKGFPYYGSFRATYVLYYIGTRTLPLYKPYIYIYIDAPDKVLINLRFRARVEG